MTGDAGLAVAIELSGAEGGVAARWGGRTATRSLARERAHASDLVATLAQVLEELGARPRDVGTIVVGLGPGSYTGLRVAAATALGLARGTGARLRGAPSFEALARARLARGESGVVLLDARAGELYVARYRAGAGGLEIHTAPCVRRAGELHDVLDGADRVFADEAALKAAALDRRALPPITPPDTRAEQTLDLGLEHLRAHGSHAPNAIEPLYLRAFAAARRAR